MKLKQEIKNDLVKLEAARILVSEVKPYANKGFNFNTMKIYSNIQNSIITSQEILKNKLNELRGGE